MTSQRCQWVTGPAAPRAHTRMTQACIQACDGLRRPIWCRASSINDTTWGGHRQRCSWPSTRISRHDSRRRTTPPAPAAALPADIVLPTLIPASGPWGVWAGLIVAGAFGMWSERTRLGKELSGALVATLAGMALANLGYIRGHPSELGVVMKYLLPLAIPLLLMSADVKRMVRETGRLLAAFFLGALCTVAGTLLAAAVFPLTPLGDQGWRIAAALTARHIGGAVNYMACCEALSVNPSILGAGLAADDLILTVYFTSIYSLAKGLPPEPGGGHSGGALPQGHGAAHAGRVIGVQDGMMAVALSALVCYLGTQLAFAWGMPHQSITIITGITVLLATLLPHRLAPLAPSAEGLAAILMQVFFAAVGASANVSLVVRTAPVLFCFSFLALAAHLLLLLLLGRLLGFSRQELLLASNANIGGPSTVAGMAAAKGWRNSLVPAILTSTMGYAIGTFTGIALGYTALAKMF